MVRDSLRSFVNRNTSLAREVLHRDDQLDALKTKTVKLLEDCMAENSQTVSRALDLMYISRCLERIGDHATNIAENAIFVVEGLDVRHHADEKRKAKNG
jgi:phosphate transport system protein